VAETECADCMAEARMRLGFMSSTETIPRNRRRELAAAYDDQHYQEHERRN
jgi:hypothetical protein